MLPENTPFSPEQKQNLLALLPSFSPEQRAWLGGFLSAGASSAGAASPVTSAASLPVTIFYGTESGNCEALAEKAVKAAKKKGLKATMKNLSESSPADFVKAQNIGIIISTWGDGEPPEAAESFYETFMKEKTDLKGVKFSVCSLGDTSYDKFCQTGKDFDKRLEDLGAERIADRVDCDVDFDDSYDEWEASFLGALVASAPASASSGAAIPAFTGAAFTGGIGIEYGRKNPYPAEVLENVLLNGEGTAKETVHVELSLEGSGLQYEAGDALAVLPINCPGVVEDLLKSAALTGDEKVEVKGLGELNLKDALSKQLDITALSRAVVKKYLALSGDSKLEALLGDDQKKAFKDWCWGRQVIDLLEEYPVKDLTAQQLVSILRKLPPRLYSIASSPKAHAGEVHLTVAAVRYDTNGKSRKGVASSFLADHAGVGEKVSVFVQPNKNFRLPADTSKPVIMVGPGTGIAPFRAFIEERAETSATGESWLFFGDQRYSYDFLYQLELQEHLKAGALTKLDVAFSRDQPEKVYVQHKMLTQGAELYAWLEKGASFYVCGDAERMANDVNDALIEIIEAFGKKSKDEALAYVDQLKKDKRYQRDVY